MAAQNQSNRWLLKNFCSAELIEIRKSPETTVGRHREARVCLRSGKVSRYHACLGLTEDSKLWVKDLKSSNGTFVNEARIEAYKPELINHGSKLGFGLPSIGEAEGEKDELIFWEVLQLNENNEDDKATTSRSGIEQAHEQVSAAVQNGETFEFASTKDEIIEISDEEDIEEKSQNEKAINDVNSHDEPSFEPQPSTSIEKVLDSFDDDITKVLRKLNNETEDNPDNEKNSNEEKELPNISNQQDNKKETEEVCDISDDDMSCSQIFQMSRIPALDDFQKIKTEMAEMNNYSYDPMIFNPTQLEIDDDGFDNTQEIVDILLDGLDDTSVAPLPDPAPAECSTSIDLESVESPASPIARKSSRLEALEPLARRKSCLDSPKKKKLRTNLNGSTASTSGRKLKRRHSSTNEVDKVETPDLDKQSSSSKNENVLREPKRNSRRLTEGGKGKKVKLDKQLTSNTDKSNEKETKGKRKSLPGDSKLDKASEEPKRRQRRSSVEVDESKNPKAEEKSSEEPKRKQRRSSVKVGESKNPKAVEKSSEEPKRKQRRSSVKVDESKNPKAEERSSEESKRKQRRSLVKVDESKNPKAEEKSSEEPKRKQRRSSLKVDESKNPKAEEKLESGTCNSSEKLKRKLSIKIDKIDKLEPKKLLMKLRSKTDSFDTQKVSEEIQSTGSLANNNGDSLDNGPLDPRLHRLPAGSTGNSNRDLSDNLPLLSLVRPTLELPVPSASKMESPIEVLQENNRRRADPRLATKMALKPTSSAGVSKVNNDRRTGRVANYNDGRTCNIDKIIYKLLNWDTSWLEYQLTTISFEPRVNETPAEKIPLKFRNFEQYYKIFNRLIFLETWESIFRSYVDSRRLQAKLQPKVEMVRKDEGFAYLDCFYEINAMQLQRGDYCKQDDLILVEYNAMQHSRNMSFGLVTSSGFTPNVGIHKIYSRINFTVMVPCVLLSKSNKVPLPRVIIQRVANLRTQIIMFKVLTNFEKSRLHSMLLCPRVNDFKIAVTHDRIIVQPDKLNSQQQTIVLEAASLCTGDKAGIYTLVGPPGTGKTHTIVNILFQIIFNHYFGKTNSKPPMILLVAPSNAAVDNLITKIVSLKEKLREDLKRKLKCVRIGPMTSISKAAKCYTLQHLAERHIPIMHHKLPAIQDAKKRKNVDLLEFCKEYFGKDYHKQLRISENLLMENSNIILTTLGSCASNAKIIDAIQKRLIHPTCCIIDEATQCHEPESLLPTLLGIDKIVMVGDPQQLNATILSKEASKLGFGDSLFTRLVNNLEKSRESPVQMLTTQYRMHPEICSFPNRQFYAGKLKSVSNPKHKLSDKIKPYLVFNCTNQVHHDDADYTNQEEMRLIKKLLATIIKVVNDKKLTYTVGIITPYNAQKNLIHENLIDIGNENSNWEININTVDSFQGSEHDIVIISCVRESTNSFVQNVHRLNVALTRAKQALYIFGNSTLFRECRPLYDLREDARGRQVCLDINSRSQSEKDFHQYLCRQ